MFDLDRVEVLAKSYEEIGDYETAEILLTNLLEIKSRSKSDSPVEVVAILCRLAVNLEAQERRSDALKYARRAFKLASGRLDPHNSYLVDSLELVRNLSGNFAAA
ncbi:MAG: tetratricopeptide repeat protein [Candidatus Obscuribacterales bacterium]|nr:tetratricopeptide repeat protein [Candidatus Obscuribacterales bacterium]